MKKLILALGIILGIIACNSEQKQADKIAVKMTDKMTAICQLTPDQTSKVKPIIKNFLIVRRENIDKYASQQDSLKIANETNRKKFVDSIKTVLSPDQFEKFKAYSAQQKANKQSGKTSEQDNGGQ